MARTVICVIFRVPGLDPGLGIDSAIFALDACGRLGRSGCCSSAPADQGLKSRHRPIGRTFPIDPWPAFDIGAAILAKVDHERSSQDSNASVRQGCYLPGRVNRWPRRHCPELILGRVDGNLNVVRQLGHDANTSPTRQAARRERRELFLVPVWNVLTGRYGRCSWPAISQLRSLTCT
jgi:hypothetical protein